ncbi:MULTISPECIES: hypothetical protein [unclassified Microbacterium]|uniref:hypothetical protein n=1 Tax=unclassified Microbacterium TaxID=2609290 RepID=UPI001FAD6D3B|nr:MULTISPECIES: hypothetical protein [unclassified Microbacterium]WDG18514.1 hypothetical protein PQV94_01945 [Microbacterium sp. Clip185]
MVTLMLDSGHLEIVLSGAEKALAFRKRNVTLDRAAISRVQLTDDPWTWLRGVRSPGTFIPATLAIGTWRYAGGKDFAVIRKKRPGVVIDLEGDTEFQRLVLGTRHGEALVRALRVDAGDDPTDIVELASS